MHAIKLERRRRPIVSALALAGGAALVLSACAADADSGNQIVSAEESTAVTLIVHDSFPSEDFAQAASDATGYDVSVVTSGDSGELATQLALTAGAPIADAFFGVDNLYVSRLVTADAVEPYVPENFPSSGDAYTYDDAGSVVPVDFGATCINIDHGWFAEAGIAEPETFEDLLDPTYEGLSVVIDPTSSSTGATFLVGTVSHFGEDSFAEYWAQLADNGAEIAEGWTAAYNGSFTQGGEGGTKPIVLSYSTSPAWTLNDEGTESTTKILPATCAQHVEYAGILSGTENLEGAQAVIDYLLSGEFQDTIADSMYMYPVDTDAYIPSEWAEFAEIPENGGLSLPAERIGEERDDWLRTWADAVGF